MNVNTNFSLESYEKELFSIIREVVSKYTPSSKVYAVGGWTRDKMIGVPSNDIDIMVSNLSGEDFARLVTQHMGIKDPNIIRENPEKSKNITTATAQIPLPSGTVLKVDFAQARKEIYNDQSRIPELQTATPQEDALRRDLTINSVFYNIMDNKVEDFTGKGIQDLITNTIRTPVDPLKTFSDDPLRIFRTIRFAAKYANGVVDPETYQALLDPSLRDMIKQKLAKERIGEEFVKMLKNPNSEMALKLLKDTGLWNDIITESLAGTKYAGKLAELDTNQQNSHHLLTIWGHTMQVVKNVLAKYPDAEGEQRVTMILAALMHDIGKLYKDIWGESKSHPGSRSYLKHEEASKEMSELILKYLKIEPYIKQVSGLAGAHMRPHQFTEGKAGSAKSLRKFIRQMGEQSLNWLDVFNLATADAYSKGLDIDPNTVKRYQDLGVKLQEALSSLSPTTDPKDILKPIINGDEIMQVLNIKRGPLVGRAIDFVKNLKDVNPNTSKEEAATELRNAVNAIKNENPGITNENMLAKKFEEKYLKAEEEEQEDVPQEQPNVPPVATPEVKQASKKEQVMETLCSMDIVKSKIEEINNLLNEKKFYEVFTILNELKEQYGNDENVIRLLAVGVFRLLIRSEKYRYNELIQHLMDKAESNFFDPTLCSYAVGILLLLETETKDEIVMEVAERMITMAPDLLRKVLNELPATVYRPKLKDKIERKLEAK